MEKAGESEVLSGRVRMGSAITEMQQYVDGLQRNLETFKKDGSPRRLAAVRPRLARYVRPLSRACSPSGGALC
jgi:hypothetical protein